MKVEINNQQLARLLQSGLIHPSDLKCLDYESKEMLKALCLKLCQPSNCKRCEAQSVCASHVNVVEIEDHDAKQLMGLN